LLDLICAMWFEAGVVFPLALHGMGTSRTHGVVVGEEEREGAVDTVIEFPSVTEEHNNDLKDVEKSSIPSRDLK